MHANGERDGDRHIGAKNRAALAPLVSERISIRIAGGACIQSDQGRAFDGLVWTRGRDGSAIGGALVQHEPGISAFVKARANDAARVVDELRVAQLPPGIGGQRRVQIDHGAVLP